MNDSSNNGFKVIRLGDAFLIPCLDSGVTAPLCTPGAMPRVESLGLLRETRLIRLLS